MMPGEMLQTRLLLGPGDNGRALDEQDYLLADFEEPWRYELSGGRPVVMSPHSEEHDDSAEPWRDRFVLYKAANRRVVQKVISEAWVRIERGKYRIADLAVYLVGARSSQRRPARAPELIVEVLSPGRESHERDLVEKRDEYHRIGVWESLVVDRSEGRVLALTHEPGGYRERVLTDADVYTSAQLPGLAVVLRDVFAECD